MCSPQILLHRGFHHYDHAGSEAASQQKQPGFGEHIPLPVFQVV